MSLIDKAIVTAPYTEIRSMERHSSAYHSLHISLMELTNINNETGEYEFQEVDQKIIINGIINRLNDAQVQLYGKDTHQLIKP